MRAFAAAFVCTLAFAPSALAAPTPPLQGLAQARRDLAALALAARSSDGAREARSAEGELAGATAASVWIDPRHAVAPAYGLTVFVDSRRALLHLERAPSGSLPSGSLMGVEAEILASDRALAEGSIVQALGGSGGLLARAGGMVLSGDRWAQTSRLDLAAEQYGAGWKDAFQALAELVVLRATSVSLATLGAAAGNALRAKAIGPAGVGFVRGRPALGASGKPEVLYVGMESCRFCAIERWGLVVALSRFGTFSNLHLSQSETTEPPVVRSFTFAGAHYQSPYLSLAAVELSGERPRPGGGFASLGRLTASERSLFRALDPKGVVPFLDVGNRTRDVGATVSPTLVAGSSWSGLAASLSRTRMRAGEAIAATAEVLTAEICRATGGAPSSVCGGAVVHEYSNRLTRFGAPGSGCAIGSGATRRGLGAGPPRQPSHPARTVTPASR